MIGELFSKYQRLVVRKAHAYMANNINFTAATCRDVVFHTIQTPIVCYSIPSIVEVSGGCQSVNIYVCANEGL